MGIFKESSARLPEAVTIANGASVSGTLDLRDSSIAGVIFPAAWTAAALTIEVYDEVALAWIGIVYDDLGTQVNVIASPVVSTAYTLSVLGMLPYRYVRLRSGTTASAVNQAGARSITVITRPLA